MTKEELLVILRGCSESHDPEVAHKCADDAICDFLRTLGNDDIVDAFEKIEKWYA